MANEVVFFYHWPLVWMGQAPTMIGDQPDYESFGDLIFEGSSSVGIKGWVFRDGMIMLNFAKWTPPKGVKLSADTYVPLINGFLACLYTALVDKQDSAIDQKMVISPVDMVVGDVPNLEAMSVDDPRIVALMSARVPGSYGPDIPWFLDWRLYSRVATITKETLEHAWSLFGELVTHTASHAIQVSDLYLRSVKAFDERNYALCVVTAWAVAEKLLRCRWDAIIEARRMVDGKVFINSDRKDKLRSRDYTASVISEILSLMENLPFEVYTDLNTARVARNNWMHGLDNSSRESALTALGVAMRMLELVEGIRFEVGVAND